MELKIFRIKAGLTQLQLCKMMHMSLQKLCDIERGNYDKITVKNIEDFSKFLNISQEELLSIILKKCKTNE